ncbi:MAG: helix-turn-helix domain-containing protein [Sneathiellaceae bacterium]
MEQLFYTIPEFAEAARISRSKVYLEIADGRLKPVKVGRRRLVSVTEARAWAARVEADTATA